MKSSRRGGCVLPVRKLIVKFSQPSSHGSASNVLGSTRMVALAFRQIDHRVKALFLLCRQGVLAKRCRDDLPGACAPNRTCARSLAAPEAAAPRRTRVPIAAHSNTAHVRHGFDVTNILLVHRDEQERVSRVGLTETASGPRQRRQAPPSSWPACSDAVLLIIHLPRRSRRSRFELPENHCETCGAGRRLRIARRVQSRRGVAEQFARREPPSAGRWTCSPRQGLFERHVRRSRRRRRRRH